MDLSVFENWPQHPFTVEALPMVALLAFTCRFPAPKEL